MRTITCLMPNPSDATSWYRAMGPLSRLKETRNDFMISMPSMVDWATLSTSAGVFVQRPCEKRHVDAIEIAKACDKFVWIDYDDDLLNVPADNANYEFFAKEETKRGIIQSLAMADVVSVSTQYLKDYLERVFIASVKNTKPPSIIVIPNALDTKKYPLEMRTGTREKIIFWRGSNTHAKDLVENMDNIVSIARENPEWQWMFMGMYPWMLEGKIKNLTHVQTLDPMKYMKFIKELQPSVIHVPLANTHFNRSKSNIAWLEGTYAGAVCIANRSMDEWDKPGIAPIYEIIEQEEECLIIQANASIEYINENLTLEKTNQLRSAILDKMFQS